MAKQTILPSLETIKEEKSLERERASPSRVVVGLVISGAIWVIWGASCLLLYEKLCLGGVKEEGRKGGFYIHARYTKPLELHVTDDVVCRHRHDLGMIR